MKKIVASASILTLGLLCGQSAQAQQDSKPWNISGSLRGFYDDNYATLPSKQAPPAASRRGSFGFEVSPSASVKLSYDTTELSARYTYGLKYYEDRANNSYDQSHQFEGAIVHSFSERYRISVSDSFVIAQEPSLIDPGVITSPLRSEGDNMVNRAKVDFTASISEQFGMGFKYENTLYDYEQVGPSSRSALLDRMEHLFTIDGRWNMLETTTILGGYSYGITEQTSQDSLVLPPAFVSPSTRDNRSHYFFVGVDQTFNPQFNVSARVGVQYVQYPNFVPPPGQEDNSLSPYVDIKATYKYSQEGEGTLGIKHSHNQTDVLSTLDAETTTAYAALYHKLTPLITGSLTGQYQHSTFNGGGADGLTDNLFTVGVKLEYEINKWLTAETGYNYDRLDSDLNARSFYRNRIFIGIRASY